MDDNRMIIEEAIIRRWCPYNHKECHSYGCCRDCVVYLNNKACDRCGKPIKKYAPLNAIPIGGKRSLPFELKVPSEFTMKPAELCIDCVQSFFDWWGEGGEK